MREAPGALGQRGVAAEDERERRAGAGLIGLPEGSSLDEKERNTARALDDERRIEVRREGVDGGGREIHG